MYIIFTPGLEGLDYVYNIYPRFRRFEGLTMYIIFTPGLEGLDYVYNIYPRFRRFGLCI